MDDKTPQHHVFQDGQVLYSAESTVDCWVWLVRNYGEYTVKKLNEMNIVLI